MFRQTERNIIHRFIWLVAIFTVSVAALSALLFWSSSNIKELGVKSIEDAMIELQKEKIKLGVETIVSSLEILIKNKPKHEQYDIIRQYLKEFRFENDNSGYYYSYDGTVVITVPPSPELEGVDRGADDKYSELVGTMWKLALDGGGFMTLRYPKPMPDGTFVETPKLYYIKMIPGTSIDVGTGIYMDTLGTTKNALTEQIDKSVTSRELLIIWAIFLFFFFVNCPLCYVTFRSISRIIKKTGEQAEQLIKMASIEEASKSKADFFAAMSHEIRTPMNAIIGMSELMPTENLTKTQISYFDTIKKMSSSLLQIVNDILDVSKIEAGKLSLVPVHYDVISLFDNICSMMKFLSHGKNLEFRSHRAENIPRYLYGDEIRLRQIYTNILTNAIKYTHEGFVSFTLEVSETEAGGAGYLKTVSGGEKNPKNRFLVAKIQDTGIGINESDIKELFKPFSKLDEKRNRNIIGTGLGLTISKKLVDLMGGAISAESVYGRGTTFTVSVPLVEGDESQSDDAQLVKVQAVPGARALVVDDTPVNIAVAEAFLNDHGISIDSAESGPQALEAVRRQRYDLIFMDHMMEGMDGIEATRKLHELASENPSFAWLGKVPIIALTANAFPEMRKVYIEAGMDDFLTKPIEAAKLNMILLNHLPREKIANVAVPIEESKERRKEIDRRSGKDRRRADRRTRKIKLVSMRGGAPPALQTPSAFSAAPRAGGDTPPATPPPHTPAEGAATPETARIQRLRAVTGLDVDKGIESTGGTEENYLMVVSIFLEELPKDLEKARAAVYNKNWSGYATVLHSLKSSLRSLGAMELGERSAALETAGKEENTEKIDKETESFFGDLVDFARRIS